MVLLESLFILEADHHICFVFYKSSKCTFVGRQSNGHNGTNCKSNNLSNSSFPKFMIKAYVGSLRKVGAHHSLGFRFWKYFQCNFEMGKKYAILMGFAHLVKWQL